MKKKKKRTFNEDGKVPGFPLNQLTLKWFICSVMQRQH